jgi:transglutaminase-like putative cysteine protease
MSDKTSMCFEITDSCVVTPTADGQAIENLWYPLIPDTAYQRVLDVSVTSPWDWEVSREATHGNTILHCRSSGKADGDAAFEIRYVVERTPVSHSLRPERAGPLRTPALFDRWLKPEQFVDVDEKTRGLAASIGGGETNPLVLARRFYEYVVGSMTYDAAQQSWKGSTEHALVCSVGNCNDIHALFLSLCRSAGIPARLVLGQALEPPVPGQENCELCGYHCWAEFFAAGLGWVPADASCACKYGKHALFGDLELNHIAWSVGRDIVLSPPQQGAPLLFFAGPYLESDGRHITSVRRSVRFKELSTAV